MGLIRLMKRVVGGGYAAVQPTDQIACDLSQATITPTGGTSLKLADFLAQVCRPAHGTLAIATLNTLPALPQSMRSSGYCQLTIAGTTYSSDDASALFTVSGTTITWLPNAPGGFPLLPGITVTYLVTY